jgi:serine/threonine protein kinase
VNATQRATASITSEGDDRRCDGGDERASALERIGQIVGGTYRLSRYIGSGGSSHVYEARHLRLGKSFALKILRSELNNGRRSVQRFRREAETIASLHDEHIVSVVDTGELDDGTPYLTMELLPGEDLRSLLDREKQLPVRRAVQIALEACRGLTVVHRVGLVHRDLKPENLFITRRSSGEDWCKVLDFGVAKVQTSQATAQGVIVGTVRYMAPEQLAGDSVVSPSTDVYAVGAILYECLAGKPLVEAASVQEAMYQIMNLDPQPLAVRRSALPASLCAIIHRCIHKIPSSRPIDAAELGHELNEFLSFGTSSADRHRDETIPDYIEEGPPAKRLFRRMRVKHALTTAAQAMLFATMGGLAWRELGSAAWGAPPSLENASKTQAPLGTTTPAPRPVPSQRGEPVEASRPTDSASGGTKVPVPRRQRQSGVATVRTAPSSLPVGHFDRTNPYE